MPAWFSIQINIDFELLTHTMAADVGQLVQVDDKSHKCEVFRPRLCQKPLTTKHEKFCLEALRI